MFVPRAHVYLGRPSNKKCWFSGSSRPKHQLPKHKIKCFEYVRMPCLIPTFIGAIVGFLIMCGGAFVCFIGYNPDKIFSSINIKSSSDQTRLNAVLNVTEPTLYSTTPEYTSLRFLAYIGPVFMGIGFFVMIVAVVLYCEIKDKYVTHIIPEKNVKDMRKEELYDMIISEFRKNYFRGIEVPLRKSESAGRKSLEKEMPTLFKALSISTPALLITPEMHRKWKDRDNASCVSVTNTCKAEIVQNVLTRKGRESWLKTSSLPNIRPKSAMRDILKAHDKAKSQHWQAKRERNQNVRAFRKPIDSTGVDNPAFRDSPTETIHLQEIGPDFSPDSPIFSHGTHLTKVLVHMDASPREHMQEKTESSDTRGYTLKRSSATTQEEMRDVADGSNLTESRSVNDNIAAPEEVLIDCGNNELKRTDMARIKSLYDLSGNRREVGNEKVGPYKTFINIFRSEPCLGGQTQPQYTETDDDDSSSVDSLALTEELLKNFEMANMVQV